MVTPRVLLEEPISGQFATCSVGCRGKIIAPLLVFLTGLNCALLWSGAGEQRIGQQVARFAMLRDVTAEGRRGMQARVARKNHHRFENKPFSEFHVDWNLPGQVQEDTIVQPWKRIKLSQRIDVFPKLKPNNKEHHWAAAARRVWIQTDQQSMERLFSGHAQLGDEGLRLLGVRIERQLSGVLENGWKPRTEKSPFIEWDGREYNSVAHHAANLALDMGKPWEWRDTRGMLAARVANANLRVCVDGALRQNGKSSGGLAVLAYYPSGRRVMLYRAGKPFGDLNSSFLAEALAMEWALEIVVTRFIT